jgi:predicted dehydrogenase
MARVCVAVVGAGGRGSRLGGLIAARDQWAQIVAVAEPIDERRDAFARDHGLDTAQCYSDWSELLASHSGIDAVVVTTMDRDHAEPAIAALEAGHHLLLEKPMAATWDDCERIATAATAAVGITAVCHSLRYGRPFRLLKEIVAAGRVGEVVTVDHLEQVLWWHQAHSFVRGKWGNESRAAFMLLAKSCHDVDYLSFLIGRPCQAVSSFGSLTYFRPEHAPPDSGETCLECRVEPDCPYSAVKLYVDTDRSAWPAAGISLDHSREAHLRAIQETPYGRCVWRCDNDVVDHQVVALEYAGGVTATLTMTGFTAVGGRRLRVHGTEGTAEFTETAVEVRRYDSGAIERTALEPEAGSHGGGDQRVTDAWLQAIHQNDRSHIVSDIQTSLETHRIVFAAERARRERRVVELAST